MVVFGSAASRSDVASPEERSVHFPAVFACGCLRGCWLRARAVTFADAFALAVVAAFA